MTAEKTVERFPSGVIMPPPSKSVSHRALICAALAGGESAMERVLGVGVSDDIAATRAALSNLLHAGMAEERSPMGSADKQDAPGIFAGRSKSAEVEGTLSTDRVDQDGAQVIAAGRSALLASEETVRVIDAAESGSTLRFILPIAAAIGGKWRFRGRGRLMSRPMDAYEKVFPAHGCRLDTFPDKNEIHLEGRLNHGNFEIPGNISSQFISGLLLALPLLDGDSAIRLSAPLESADYVHMTIDVMRAFGVVVDTMGNGDWRIRGGQRYHAVDFRIEKDWSQAAFFLGAAALGCDVSIAGLSMDSLQGDKRILDILRAMGAEIIEAMCPGLPINRSDRMDNAGNMNNAGNMDDIDCMDNIHSTDGTGGMKEVGHRANTDVIPVLRVVPSADGLKAIDIDVSEIPDLVPPIAVLACFAEGTSRLTGAGRLRLKESDRLSALCEELGKLGAIIKENAESLIIEGRKTLPGGCADAHGDHRIAMAVALGAIRCEGRVTLTGWESVRKSYPDFWQDFEGGLG